MLKTTRESSRRPRDTVGALTSRRARGGGNHGSGGGPDTPATGSPRGCTASRPAAATSRGGSDPARKARIDGEEDGGGRGPDLGLRQRPDPQRRPLEARRHLPRERDRGRAARPAGVVHPVAGVGRRDTEWRTRRSRGRRWNHCQNPNRHRSGQSGSGRGGACCWGAPFCRPGTCGATRSPSSTRATSCRSRTRLFERGRGTSSR